MSQILIVYSTTDGHTTKISRTIEQALLQKGHSVVFLPMADVRDAHLNDADFVLVGASIRYGKHQPELFAFAKTHETVLSAKPSAFFTVNLVARKAEKCSPETNSYLVKFLQQVNWVPDHLAVFAGKLNYPAYGFFDKHIIRFIMWLTKGPTDLSTVKEFTDWQAVNALATRVHESLGE